MELLILVLYVVLIYLGTGEIRLGLNNLSDYISRFVYVTTDELSIRWL